MTLWLLSLVVPIILAALTYFIMSWNMRARCSLSECRTAAIAVFVVMFGLTAAYNVFDDGVEPDPYHDAKPWAGT